jgi:two-component system osmolarity sensor histidine kinase EnvZ
MPRSLWWRSVLIIMTPLLLMQIIASWVFYDRHWQVVTKRLAGALSSEIHAVVLLVEDRHVPSEQSEIFSLAAHTMSFKVSLHEGPLPSAEAAPLTWLAPTALRERLSQGLHKIGRPFSIDEVNHEGEVLVHVALRWEKPSYLTFWVSRKRLFSTTIYIFLFWFLGAGFLLFGVAGLFWRNQVRPIHRLALAAEEFGKGRDVERFKAEGASEVRQAASAFIGMRDRLRRQVTQRTRMLAGVSHDLRTPLTRMRLVLAMSSDAETREAMEEDIKDMEAMIEGYLSFARGEGVEALERRDLADMLRRIVEASPGPGELQLVIQPVKRNALPRSGGLELSGDLDLDDEPMGPYEALIMPRAVRRAVDNLVSNAQRFAGRIRITLITDRQAFTIRVDDDGPGIPADKREEVLQPFYRLEESRNEATGGVGLGLSITLDIALAHGGRLELGHSPMGGLRAELILPR